MKLALAAQMTTPMIPVTERLRPAPAAFRTNDAFMASNLGHWLIDLRLSYSLYVPCMYVCIYSRLCRLGERQSYT